MNNLNFFEKNSRHLVFILSCLVFHHSSVWSKTAEPTIANLTKNVHEGQTAVTSSQSNTLSSLVSSIRKKYSAITMTGQIFVVTTSFFILSIVYKFFEKRLTGKAIVKVEDDEKEKDKIFLPRPLETIKMLPSRSVARERIRATEKFADYHSKLDSFREHEYDKNFKNITLSPLKKFLESCYSIYQRLKYVGNENKRLLEAQQKKFQNALCLSNLSNECRKEMIAVIVYSPKDGRSYILYSDFQGIDPKLITASFYKSSVSKSTLTICLSPVITDDLIIIDSNLSYRIASTLCNLHKLQYFTLEAITQYVSYVSVFGKSKHRHRDTLPRNDMHNLPIKNPALSPSLPIKNPALSPREEKQIIQDIELEEDFEQSIIKLLDGQCSEREFKKYLNEFYSLYNSRVYGLFQRINPLRDVKDEARKHHYFSLPLMRYLCVERQEPENTKISIFRTKAFSRTKMLSLKRLLFGAKNSTWEISTRWFGHLFGFKAWEINIPKKHKIQKHNLPDTKITLQEDITS